MRESITTCVKKGEIQFGKFNQSLTFKLEVNEIIARLRKYLKNLSIQPDISDKANKKRYYYGCKMCGQKFSKSFCHKDFLQHINGSDNCSYYAIRKNRKKLPDFRFLAQFLACQSFATQLDRLDAEEEEFVVDLNLAERGFLDFVNNELEGVIMVAFIATSNVSFATLENMFFLHLSSHKQSKNFIIEHVLQSTAWSLELSVLSQYATAHTRATIVVDGWKSVAKHNILGVCLTAPDCDKFTYNEPLGTKTGIGAAKQLESVILYVD